MLSANDMAREKKRQNDCRTPKAGAGLGRPKMYLGSASGNPMKAKIIITPKKAVVDPQGKTVQSALAHMGYNDLGAVHVGKYLEIELAGTDKETARKQIDDACHKIL